MVKAGQLQKTKSIYFENMIQFNFILKTLNKIALRTTVQTLYAINFKINIEYVFAKKACPCLSSEDAYYLGGESKMATVLTKPLCKSNTQNTKYNSIVRQERRKDLTLYSATYYIKGTKCSISS